MQRESDQTHNENLTLSALSAGVVSLTMAVHPLG
jgi:hypothetical protein